MNSLPLLAFSASLAIACIMPSAPPESASSTVAPAPAAEPASTDTDPSADDSAAVAHSRAGFEAPPPKPPAPRDATQTVELPVPGFLPAVLVVPAGDDERPLLVAAHGAGGAPEWDCEYWRRLLSARVFVLCLRGTAMGGGSYYYRQHHALRAELEAATGAARAKFPRIASSRGLYAGFSQGASMGSLVVAHQGSQFSYVILLEGSEQWNVALGRAFAGGGGQGVLWVCGTPACATKAERSAQAATQAGLKARAEHALGAGHTPLGEVQTRLVAQLPWLLGDDPLWQPAIR